HAGDLVYRSGGLGTQRRMIYWLESAGEPRPFHLVPDFYYSPCFSPDGKRLAFAIASSQGNMDIWVQDLDRDTPSRLRFLKGTNNLPRWMPDGKNIIFNSGGDSPGIYAIRADGSGKPWRLSGK